MAQSQFTLCLASAASPVPSSSSLALPPLRLPERPETPHLPPMTARPGQRSAWYCTWAPQGGCHGEGGPCSPSASLRHCRGLTPVQLSLKMRSFAYIQALPRFEAFLPKQRGALYLPPPSPSLPHLHPFSQLARECGPLRQMSFGASGRLHRHWPSGIKIKQAVIPSFLRGWPGLDRRRKGGGTWR